MTSSAPGVGTGRLAHQAVQRRAVLGDTADDEVGAADVDAHDVTPAHGVVLLAGRVVPGSQPVPPDHGSRFLVRDSRVAAPRSPFREPVPPVCSSPSSSQPTTCRSGWRRCCGATARRTTAASSWSWPTTARVPPPASCSSASGPGLGVPLRHVWHEDQGFRKCEHPQPRHPRRPGRLPPLHRRRLHPAPRPRSPCTGRSPGRGGSCPAGTSSCPSPRAAPSPATTSCAGRATSYALAAGAGRPAGRQSLRLAMGAHARRAARPGDVHAPHLQRAQRVGLARRRCGR